MTFTTCTLMNDHICEMPTKRVYNPIDITSRKEQLCLKLPIIGKIKAFKTDRERPDTRQSSCGRFGRSINAKTTRNFRNISDGKTEGRTDG